MRSVIDMRVMWIGKGDKKGETQGGTYHNDKPGQNERNGEGIEREVPM